MRLRISHTTRYRFDNPVTYGLQQLRTTPKSTHNQTVVNWRTEIEGGRKQLSFQDHHRNLTELFSFEKDVQELVISSTGEVEVAESTGVLGPHIGPSPLWLYEQPTPRTKAGSAVRTLVRDIEGDTSLEQLHMLMRLISEQVDYEIDSSEPDWDAETALAAGKGVCQDHTHIYLACAREMGFPARYVSGFLMLDHTVEQDAMHAWAEAHVDGLGWVGFDVSNCISPDTRYVRVATGLDYREAAPMTGTREGAAGGEALSVEIEVAQQ